MDFITNYLSASDPRHAGANKVAFLAGAIMPFYPALLYWLAPGIGWWALVTVLTFPIYLLVPAIGRRNAMFGQQIFVGFILLNTLWCVTIMGGATNMPLYAISAVAMTVFMSGNRKLWMGICLVTLVISTRWWPFAPLRPLNAADTAGAFLLNAVIVFAQVAGIARTAATTIDALRKS